MPFEIGSEASHPRQRQQQLRASSIPSSRAHARFAFQYHANLRVQTTTRQWVLPCCCCCCGSFLAQGLPTAQKFNKVRQYPVSDMEAQPASGNGVLHSSRRGCGERRLWCDDLSTIVPVCIICQRYRELPRGNGNSLDSFCSGSIGAYSYLRFSRWSRVKCLIQTRLIVSSAPFFILRIGVAGVKYITNSEMFAKYIPYSHIL